MDHQFYGTIVDRRFKQFVDHQIRGNLYNLDIGYDNQSLEPSQKQFSPSRYIYENGLPDFPWLVFDSTRQWLFPRVGM
jgi:hypothetical protein